MNRKAFFDAVRMNPFNGQLSQSQVDGLNAILDGWLRCGLTDLRWLAYMLATAFHETARTMQPIKEYGGNDYFMKMYDKTGARPKVAASLGNTEVGDGARFCGRGYVQLTGRANYAKASQKLGVDFVKEPDRALMPNYAAEIMFLGMTEGWFTGKKLADYFNTRADWTNARRIINALDRASTVAGYATAFQNALQAASQSTGIEPRPEGAVERGEPKKPPDSGARADMPSKPPEGGFFSALIAFLALIFGRR
jgi:putative chitinase